MEKSSLHTVPRWKGNAEPKQWKTQGTPFYICSCPPKESYEWWGWAFISLLSTMRITVSWWVLPRSIPDVCPNCMFFSNLGIRQVCRSPQPSTLTKQWRDQWALLLANWIWQLKTFSEKRVDLCAPFGAFPCCFIFSAGDKHPQPIGPQKVSSLDLGILDYDLDLFDHNQFKERYIILLIFEHSWALSDFCAWPPWPQLKVQSRWPHFCIHMAQSTPGLVCNRMVCTRPRATGHVMS